MACSSIDPKSASYAAFLTRDGTTICVHFTKPCVLSGFVLQIVDVRLCRWQHFVGSAATPCNKHKPMVSSLWLLRERRALIYAVAVLFRMQCSVVIKMRVIWLHTT